ncbi:type I glutamate--ammonia ligase [Gloeobacter kilaueensis]|uniref:Glutamine synthetase n=1 Tax=Gloeobacter kilaueensis (strain ATCC BAA-2537 / CCAP 1431/1 / ULC 316 / JS1) TaxID=1183438 RepID=U5QFE5_GLOK1|nr:type I glutamate--ammonia ligase [Gloeobacter kilaueensis]AGY57697.1 glutamine synthetase, type I [Gloeobacter kilaueensis JS1]
MAKTPDDVLKLIKDEDVKIVDLKFIDLPGIWQHCSFAPSQIDADAIIDGIPFDGSSIRGWKTINESDMLMVPDPSTAFIDPFFKEKTLSLTCSIREPRTGEPYSRDPRTIASKALDYLKNTGIADTAYFGPEAEFFILDDARFDQTQSSGYYYIDSVEANWNTGRAEGPNLAYKNRPKEGYFPVAPSDSQQDLRTEMLLTMGELGIPIEKHHHEVAAGGQAELGFRFLPLVEAADALLIYKYVIKNVARKYGKVATFMPKPVFNDNGTGMHTHQSLWKDGKPLFFGDKYANLSETALHYIGGLLKHAPAILAFSNPTTNSYKRLVPGFEAPVNLAYSQGNRSASIRIPISGSNPKAKRLEFRCPDASSNPYLAFSAMLLAGLDGIKNKIDPGEPLDVDIYELSPEELAKVPSTPGSLSEALKALEEDHAFLTEGGVFTEELISTWIEYKLAKEVIPLSLRPHPYEFVLYFDV